MSDESSADMERVEVDAPLLIAERVPSALLKLYHAEYNKEQRMLSFNEDIWIVVKSEDVHPVIYIMLPDVTICFNANVKISFECDVISVYYCIQMDRDIDGTLEFCGNGSLTIDLPEKSRNDYAISCPRNLIIRDCDITINSTGKEKTDYRGIVSEEEGSITLYNAKIKLDNGDTDYRNVALLATNVGDIRIIDSSVECILGNTETIQGISAITGSIQIDRSRIDILCQDSKTITGEFYIKSSGDFKMSDSTLNMELKSTKDGGIRPLYVTGTNMATMINCTMNIDANCQTDVLECKIGLNVIHCDISVIMPKTEKPLNAWLICENSDVEIRGSKNCSSNIFYVNSYDKILGSDGTAIPTKDISIEDIPNYAWVHIISSFTVSFDLAGGEGTSVDPISGHPGDTITLPECDATKGDLVFIGWSDGKELYKAGSEYTIGLNKTLTAMYAEPYTPEPVPPVPPVPEPEQTDNTAAIIGAIIVAVVIVGLLGAVFYTRK